MATRLLARYFMLCGIALHVAAAVVLLTVAHYGPTAAAARLRGVVSEARARAMQWRDARLAAAGAERVSTLRLARTPDAFAYRPVNVPLAAGLGRGRVLTVGVGKQYASPAAAVAEAHAGDIIEIEPGTYIETMVVTTPDLVLRGAGGIAHMNGAGVALVQDKAIWLIKADNILIENIEFSGARSGDANGAGIRAEGDRLHIVACGFHDNQTAVLSNPLKTGRITIEYSEFARNGHDNGQAHQIYIGNIAEFELSHSYVHDGHVGSAVKSRAALNRIIGNRIVDGAAGTSNYEIDLSEGGFGYIIGNEIEQGPNTRNPDIIAFAPERRPEQGEDEGQELYVVHNTIVNDAASGVFVHNFARGRVYLYNNLLLGPGAPVRGASVSVGNLLAGTDADADGTDAFGDGPGTGDNRVVREEAVRDRGALDYRLAAASPAIDAGRPLAAANDVELAPKDEYLHPAQRAERRYVGLPDAGALEYRAGGDGDAP